MPARLVVLVIVVVAALSAAAATLAAIHERVRHSRGRLHFDRGRSAADRGDLAAALDEYRASLALDLNNVAAERELALTLQALGRLPEAESYFDHLLEHDPTNGPLNRGLARIHAARGNSAAARASYQRAIYGEWPSTSAGRLDTRFELVDYLRAAGASDEILPELLRLKAEVPSAATETVRRVSDLLVHEGAFQSAEEMLQAGSLAAPRDVELLADLADVQLRAGQTANARTTLVRAVSIGPRREELRARLTVVDRMLALDPTLPRLRMVARARRAHDLLDAVLQQTRDCADAAELSGLRAEAKRRLADRRHDAHLAEQQLDLASRMWQLSDACHPASGEAQAIDHVLRHVRAAEDRTQ